ncbi:MAG: hypothetical protein JNL32_09035 [Candidatus Kapabacteria bacterium]|nr:hypothetical protein [Candidatus Kapabacteria bacterium]
MSLKNMRVRQTQGHKEPERNSTAVVCRLSSVVCRLSSVVCLELTLTIIEVERPPPNVL